jgi:hypothetical protein
VVLSDTVFLIIVGGAVGVGLLAVWGGIVNGRRWRTARIVERLSKDPKLVSLLPDTTAALSTEPSDVIPPLHVDFRKPRQFPKLPRLNRVTVDANVVGRPPMRIAYLRLFENQPRMRTFIQGPWREFGYVVFLRSATAVTPAELRSVTKSRNVASLFIVSPDRMKAEIDRPVDQPQPKGRAKFTNVGGTTIRTRDHYGSYPVRPVLCHGEFWKQAVDMLLERVHLVALDLSGYTNVNEGTRHELQRVIDRLPIERVIFLVDQRSDRKFVEAELQRAWAQMAARSPNAVHDSKTAIVAITDDYRSSQNQSQSNPSTQVQLHLVARRRETRRVAAAAQDRVDAYYRATSAVSSGPGPAPGPPRSTMARPSR